VTPDAAASAGPASLLARVLDTEVEVPDDALSTRILDAALAVGAASGMRHLTIDEVARRARVGRMTVYRRFGDKNRLVEALTVRECRRCLVELDNAIGPDAPIEAQIAEGFVTSLRLAREHPLLNRLARLEPETVLAALTDGGGAVFPAARAFVAARLRASQRTGVMGEFDVDAAAELLVRLAFSFVLLQESVLALEDEAAMRATARRLIAPALSEAAQHRQGAAGST
jgi:AcrR family transcriptional regulator